MHRSVCLYQLFFFYTQYVFFLLLLHAFFQFSFIFHLLQQTSCVSMGLFFHALILKLFFGGGGPSSRDNFVWLFVWSGGWGGGQPRMAVPRHACLVSLSAISFHHARFVARLKSLCQYLTLKITSQDAHLWLPYIYYIFLTQVKFDSL